MPPYALPGNMTQTGIKTRSTLGGGVANFNEIRFEDKKGAEQLYIHAEKNQDNVVENDASLSVGHDRKKTVDHDETTHVKHDRTETVDNNETITIGNDRSETVNGNEKINIAKDRSESVTGNENVSITGNRDEMSSLWSAATRLRRQIATGLSSTRPRRQAGSQGRSHTRPRMPGNTLDSRLTM